MTTDYIWTREREALLKDLWLVKDFSSNEVAERFGITRSAVMGKVHRLGLKKGGLKSYQSSTTTTKDPQKSPVGGNILEKAIKLYHAQTIAWAGEKWAWEDASPEVKAKFVTHARNGTQPLKPSDYA